MNLHRFSMDGNPWKWHASRWESVFHRWESMRIDFKSILKTFVMDFRDNGFPIDGKSILIDGDPWKSFLIDGNPWKIDSHRWWSMEIVSHRWESMGAQPGLSCFILGVKCAKQLRQGCKYIECDSLTRSGVDEIFEAAVRFAFSKGLKPEQGSGVRNPFKNFFA